MPALHRIARSAATASLVTLLTWCLAPTAQAQTPCTGAPSTVPNSGCVGADAPSVSGSQTSGTLLTIDFRVFASDCIPSDYAVVIVGLEAPQPLLALVEPPACPSPYDPCNLGILPQIVALGVNGAVLSLTVPLIPSAQEICPVFQGACVRPPDLPTRPRPCVMLSKAVRVPLRPQD